MTLIDENAVNKIAGNTELVSTHKSCGGSAGNTMIALAQLGQNSFYSCKVGNDSNGEFFAKELEGIGLSTNLLNGLYEGQTGQCMVFVTPDAERTMNTHLGITETFSEKEIDFNSLASSEFLYVEGYLVTSPTGRAAAIKALEFARKNNVKTALTFSDPSMPTYFKDGLLEMLGDDKVDLLFCNKEELFTFTGEDDLENALENASSFADRIVMTNGAEGAIFYQNGETFRGVAPKVKPIDTIGAGDLFAGAFLYSFSQDIDIVKCLNFSCACASKVVTQYGSRLTQSDILSLRSEYLGF
jgi:sugar/nucleoside kinase (ribokinase family)